MSYHDQLEGGNEPTFKAETVGDTLIGHVVDEYEFEGEYGPCPVLTIQTSDDTSTLNGEAIPKGETYRLFGFGTVLKNEIEKVQTRQGGTLIGSLVGARYAGVSDKHKPGASPAKLWRFRQFVGGAAAAAPEPPAVATSASDAPSDETW